MYKVKFYHNLVLTEHIVKVLTKEAILQEIIEWLNNHPFGTIEIFND